jgi:hypothetical protein
MKMVRASEEYEEARKKRAKKEGRLVNINSLWPASRD